MGSRREANSSTVRKRIEGHRFDGEDGEEYEGSKFGGFPEYFRRKKIKLQNLDAERRSQNAEKPRIFRGVVVHVNGYTQPSLRDLHHMIVDYGGGFLQYLDGKTMVTHVIASSLTPKKKVEFAKYRVVKPAWVVDSVQAGKLLPWDNYRVVDEGTRQNVLGFQSGNVVSQANTQRSGYREQTDTSWYTGQVKDVARQLGSHALAADLPPSGQASQYQDGDDDEPTPVEVDSAGDPPMDKPDEAQQEMLAVPTESMEVGEPTELDVASRELEPAPAVDTDRGMRTPDYRHLAHEQFEEPQLDSLRSRDSNGGDTPQGKTPATAAEHNAALLADPKIWKSTVVNPAFLKQYYEESRLHHLSTWKAELKSRLQKHASTQKRPKRPQGARRYILHVDFDSFFAAVSLRSRPDLVDKPVVVAHGNGAGAEIASCNYPARKHGVKNGMWMKRAQELCPNLQVLPYDFKAYEATSRDFYTAIMDLGGIVQSVSIDEALLDISDICIGAGGRDGKSQNEGSVYREQAKADQVATELRARVKEMTQCNVSVGIGGNILLAKGALRKAKPAGQYQIRPEEILDFIGGLSVQDLPGVAYSMGGRLEEMGVKLVKDLRELSKERLTTSLGPKTGEKLWEYARGIDRAEVGDQVVRKSVSAEVNWGVRFATQEQADEFVTNLCEELHKRLLNEGVKGRQLTMKIMRKAAHVPMNPPKHLGHGPCDVFNKSVVLGVATNDGKVLSREAISILKSFNFPPGELRGLGIQCTKLDPIKSIEKPFDSSQRRLHFKSERTPKAPKDAIEDIDSPVKPTKFVKHPAAALSAFEMDGEQKAALNTMGTQFILPTQADPAVLSELPQDIRSKLTAKSRDEDHDHRQSRLHFNAGSASPTPGAQLAFPSPQARLDELPPQSQLDPEALAALPDELREEVMGFYRQSPPKAHSPAPLPPSPQPKRMTMPPPAKKALTPTKRRTNTLGRGRPRGSKKATSTRSTLTQANFVAAKAADADPSPVGDDAGAAIDPDILAALPEDIREEVLAQQRRERLQKRGGLGLQHNRKRPRPVAPAGPRFVHLPERPPRPAFTADKLTDLPELRTAISAWVTDFRDEEPNEEDVGALVAYLRRVVLEERDMSKAVAVAKWLDYTVATEDEGGELWAEALARVKEEIQSAVRERGLGDVAF